MSQFSEIQRFLSLPENQQDSEIFESLNRINEGFGGTLIDISKRAFEKFDEEQRKAYFWLTLDAVSSMAEGLVKKDNDGVMLENGGIQLTKANGEVIRCISFKRHLYSRMNRWTKCAPP